MPLLHRRSRQDASRSALVRTSCTVLRASRSPPWRAAPQRSDTRLERRMGFGDRAQRGERADRDEARFPAPGVRGVRARVLPPARAGGGARARGARGGRPGGARDRGPGAAALPLPARARTGARRGEVVVRRPGDGGARRGGGGGGGGGGGA